MTSSFQKSHSKQQLSKRDLDWLRSQLKYGDIKRIAFMSNYSVYTVRLFFKGENNHTEILEATVLLLDKRQKSFEKIQELIWNKVGTNH